MHVLPVLFCCIGIYVFWAASLFLYVLHGGRFALMKKLGKCDFIESVCGTEFQVSFQKVTDGSWKYMMVFSALVGYCLATELVPHPSPLVSNCLLVLTVVGSFMFSVCSFHWNQGKYVIYAFIGNGCYISLILISCFFHMMNDYVILMIPASFGFLSILVVIQWMMLHHCPPLQTQGTYPLLNPVDDDHDAILQQICKDGFEMSAGVGLGFFLVYGNLADTIQKHPRTFAYLAICNAGAFLAFFMARFFRKGTLSKICLFFGLFGFHSMLLIIVLFKNFPGYEPVIMLSTFLCLLVFQNTMITWLCDFIAAKIATKIPTTVGSFPSSLEVQNRVDSTILTRHGD